MDTRRGPVVYDKLFTQSVTSEEMEVKATLPTLTFSIYGKETSTIPRRCRTIYQMVRQRSLDYAELNVYVLSESGQVVFTKALNALTDMEYTDARGEVQNEGKKQVQYSCLWVNTRSNCRIV